MHEVIEEDYGVPHGHVKIGELDVLLERARHRPFSNEENGIIEQAAILLEGMVRLHIFIDGNKRTALESIREFLNNNDRVLIVPLSGVDFMYRLARDPDLDSDEAICQIKDWLTAHSAGANEKIRKWVLLARHLVLPALTVMFFARIGMKRFSRWLIRKFIIKQNQDSRTIEFILGIYEKQLKLLDLE